MTRKTLIPVGLALALIAPSSASAAVSVTKAELNAGTVRVEGVGALPNSTVTVVSAESTASASADGNGAFRVGGSGFVSRTCTATVNNGTSSVQATLAGCTPASATPPPVLSTPPPPVISPLPPPPTTTSTGNIGLSGVIGHGRIVSTPAGINCLFAATGVTGPCNADFPTGTVVRLQVTPAVDSKFTGWRSVPGCADGSKVTALANTRVICNAGIFLK
jgi:hypothetical protein